MKKHMHEENIPSVWEYVAYIKQKGKHPPVNTTVGQRKKVTAVTLLPARPRPDQRGTYTGQIRKVPVYEIA